MDRLALPAAVLALLLAACGSEEREGGPAPDEGRAALSGPLVYSRGGGFAGGVYRLTIRPDGRGRLETVGTAPRDVTLAREELSEVAADLEAADLPSRNASYAPDRPAPDAFGHRVEYEGRSVRVDEAADGVPEALRSLVGGLSALLDRLRR